MARARSQLQLVRSLRKGEATRTYIWGLARLRPDMAGRMHGGALSKESSKRRDLCEDVRREEWRVYWIRSFYEVEDGGEDT